MTQPLTPPSIKLLRKLPLVVAGLLFGVSTIFSCSGGSGGPTATELGVLRMDADLVKREVGAMVAMPAASFTPWYGRHAADPNAPQVIGDLRPALVCDLPGMFAYPISKDGKDQRLTTAVRRTRPGKVETVRAEVFWRVDEQLTSLAAVELPGGDESWHDLKIDLPAGEGELLFMHRFNTPGLAEQGGEPVAWSQPALAPLAKPALPDVIVLTIDTLRVDALEHAPYLQALMDSGRVWQQAYSPSNWTLPAYASLLTGLSPEEHGCGRGPFAEEATRQMEERSFRALGNSPTITEAMRNAGYATAMYFQNPLLESWTGFDRGFDRYVRTADRAKANHEPALAWWQQNNHRARFLTLHYMAPHLPYLPPTAAQTGLPPNPLNELKPENLFEKDVSAAERKAYFDISNTDREAVRDWYHADVAAMDLELKILIEQLRASSPNCMILIHSDHGEELWDAGSFEHGHSFDDSVIQVPLAVVHPGNVEAQLVETPVAAHHLGTFMLELLEIPNTLPASALGGSEKADRTIRSAYPLFRSETGGRELQANGRWLELPFQLEGSPGKPGVIDAETAARMAELGYSGELPND
ncbi:MAG: sulfatase-like hydrolase/transferase [Planctomycetes bacterium]|nr:sulfatase-like hydrolase/transferase [Planctomycetota bacterium]